MLKTQDRLIRYVGADVVGNFVSQIGDPVTPLRAARAMANSFGEESAALLVQNG